MEFVGESPPPLSADKFLHNSWAEYFDWTYLPPGLAFEPADDPMLVDTPRTFTVALPPCVVDGVFWAEDPMDVDIRISWDDDVMQVDWPTKPDSPMLLDDAPLQYEPVAQEQVEIMGPVVVIVTPPSPPANALGLA